MPVLPTYDTTKVSDISLSYSQYGGTTNHGGWADLTFSTGSTSWTRGIAFDFSVNNEAERGLALAPRIPFTTATSDAAGTGETANTWTLTIGTARTSIPNWTNALYGVVAPNPDVWSATNLPSVKFITTGKAFLISTITAASSEWTLNGTTYDLVWNFNFLTNYPGAVSGITLISPMHKAVNNPLWNGVVQFVFNPGSPMSITSLSFAGKTHKGHTGQMNVDIKKRGRMVHDYITGQPYSSTEAVEDGYREGVMLHPDNYDPADPLDTDFFTPPPGEGVTDDNIIDLE